MHGRCMGDADHVADHAAGSNPDQSQKKKNNGRDAEAARRRIRQAKRRLSVAVLRTRSLYAYDPKPVNTRKIIKVRNAQKPLFIAQRYYHANRSELVYTLRISNLQLLKID